jgi:hypothetical protein
VKIRIRREFSRAGGDLVGQYRAIYAARLQRPPVSSTWPLTGVMVRQYC